MKWYFFVGVLFVSSGILGESYPSGSPEALGEVLVTIIGAILIFVALRKDKKEPARKKSRRIYATE